MPEKGIFGKIREAIPFLKPSETDLERAARIMTGEITARDRRELIIGVYATFREMNEEFAIDSIRKLSQNMDLVDEMLIKTAKVTAKEHISELSH